MILAGDVGGTNTRLAFVEATGDRLTLIVEEVFPSREHANLEGVRRAAGAAGRGVP